MLASSFSMHSVARLIVVGLATLSLTGCDAGSGGPAGPAGSSASRPPVFDARPYTEAKAAATAEGKWLIVKATADWCGPCKQMDKTTWRDDAVVAWCKENAIVVALDVDQEPAVAKELGVSGIPTTVAFQNGTTEIDRLIGMRDGPAFLAWLEGVEGSAR
jgi:thiol:disulfide interchange protein